MARCILRAAVSAYAYRRETGRRARRFNKGGLAPRGIHGDERRHNNRRGLRGCPRFKPSRARSHLYDSYGNANVSFRVPPDVRRYIRAVDGEIAPRAMRPRFSKIVPPRASPRPAQSSRPLLSPRRPNGSNCIYGGTIPEGQQQRAVQKVSAAISDRPVNDICIAGAGAGEILSRGRPVAVISLWLPYSLAMSIFSTPLPIKPTVRRARGRPTTISLFPLRPRVPREIPGAVACADARALSRRIDRDP